MSALVLLAALLLGVSPALGQAPGDPAAVEREVAARFHAGDFVGVIEATDGIAKALRGRPKEPDFVPRMRLLAELLTRRAIVERSFGRLDAAEESLEVAGRTLGDPDLQRMVAAYSRSQGDKAIPALVPLELTNLALIDAQIDLALALIEAEVQARAEGQEPRSDPAAEGAATKPKPRRDLRQLFDGLLYKSRALREGLPGRLEQADPGLRGSAAARALASLARPMLHQARAALIMAAGPAGTAAQTSAAPDPRKLLADALELVQSAMAPALEPAAEDDERPEAELRAASERTRAEAAIITAAYHEWIARAHTVAGDRPAARAALKEALEARAAAGQRAHPDLFESLLLGGEWALAEAEETAAAGELAAARVALEQGVAWLTRARGMVAACPGCFDESSASPQRIETLLAAAIEEDRLLAVKVTTSDAVDAAARRTMRAFGGGRKPPPPAGEAASGR